MDNKELNKIHRMVENYIFEWWKENKSAPSIDDYHPILWNIMNAMINDSQSPRMTFQNFKEANSYLMRKLNLELRTKQKKGE